MKPWRGLGPLRVLAVAAATIAVVWLGFALIPFPELSDFMSRPVSVRILDRNGVLIGVTALPDGTRSEYLTLDELPDDVTAVFIAAEDRRFRYHPGVDPAALLRSAVQNIREGRIVSGASTITMQLASIVSPRPATVPGKAAEMIDALRIEAKLSKREILELWINAVPFSYNTRGVASAARRFFDRDAAALSRAQTALLAVIPRRPSAYNPVENPEAAAAAAARMCASAGLKIEREELEREAAAAAWGRWPDPAPHFTRYLVRSSPRFSLGLTAAAVSSLDIELNRFIERELGIALHRYRNNRISNGAVVVLSNATGQILAYVGSQGFDDPASGQVDGVRAPGQPGSALKPFLYAYAIDQGFRPNTVLPDIPMVFGREEGYEPVNFDERYRGPVTMRVALSSSLNIPAVYMLERLGVGNFGRFLENAGFEGMGGAAAAAGLGLALGNAEVSLLELARAFAAFPALGHMTETTCLLDEGERRVMVSPYAAAVVCDILSDSASRYGGFGEGRVFDIPRDVMFKTGTANRFQDIWALGATEKYTVGVWMGNSDGSTVQGRTGSSIPAEIAAAVLMRISSPGERLPEVPGADAVELCALSGKRPGVWCDATYIEYLPAGEDPGSCDFHAEGGRIVLPELYGDWTAVPESGSRPVIISPNDGAVFYYDPSAPAESQAIRISASGTGGPAVLYVNGMNYGESRSPYTWDVPLGRGRFTFTVKSPRGEDTVAVEVR